MNFMTIGRVGAYLRQKNLSFAANYKIQTGQSVADSNGNLNFTQSSMFNQINASTKKTSAEVKTARLAVIKSKLMSGKKLSTEEMAYLRENDDELYKKAKHAEEKREELKSELKGAKSKKEARQILTQAMVEASAEACAELSAIGSGAAIGGNVMAGALSGGGVSISMPTENFSAATNFSMPIAEISTPTENFSANSSTSIENFSANSSTPAETSSTDAANSTENSKQSIFEKFIMTVRALEDEFSNFTRSKGYKELPEDSLDDREVYIAPKFDSKILDAVLNYRRAAQKNSSLNF